MASVNIIFFGSTNDSSLVLNQLFSLHLTSYILNLVAVVTQPARPVGRKQVLTPTPVEIWAKSHNIAVLSFPTNPDKPWLYENEQTVIDALEPTRCHLVVSACYGQKIPSATIKATKYGGLNVHPSLLPRWRGADPVPWAILSGDHQTGVTIVTLEDHFDAGRIIAQKKIPILDTDFSDHLRTKLFTVGAQLLTEILPEYLTESHNSQLTTNNLQPPYARRLTREDGFIPWELLKLGMSGETAKLTQLSGILLTAYNLQPSTYNLGLSIFHAFRAFSPWPGLWTKVNLTKELKRLKILDLNLQPTTHNLQLITVQLEGKNPVSFDIFQKAYLL